MKKYIYITIAILFTCTAIWGSIEHRRANRLQDKLSIAYNNNKAYESSLDTLKDKTVQFQYTIAQLSHLNDSIIGHLEALRRDLKIKDKQIQSMSYIATEGFKRDTIRLRDTIFVEHVNIDTTLVDPWVSFKIKLEYPNKIDIGAKFVNKLNIYTTDKKDFIPYRKKFFIARWFQKKQNIIVIEAYEENPYCSIREQRHIKVLKK